MVSDLKLGTDLVRVSRLSRAYERHGERFFKRLLTEGELAYCRSGAQSDFLRRAAARVAAKEATSKALGTGIRGWGWATGVRWKTIEVVSAERQAPTLRLHEEAAQAAEEQNIQQWRLSLSHEGDYAMATVIGLAN